MSHYDEETGYEWYTVLEHTPNDERVTLSEASLLEQKVAGHVCEAQATVKRRVSWAAFFADTQQAIIGSFDVSDETQSVYREYDGKLDDIYYSVKQELENDTVINSLYRLNVPFRVIVERQEREDGYTPSRLSFQIVDSVSSLVELYPEPVPVIQTQSDGRQFLGELYGIPESDNGYIYTTEDEYPGCSLGEWESILGRELTSREELVLEVVQPYTPRPTVDGFERMMDIGLSRLDGAERVADVVGVDIYSHRE